MLQIDTLPAYAPHTDTASSTALSAYSTTHGAQTAEIVCAYDTIFTPLEQQKSIVRKSLFTQHELQVQSSHEKTIMHEDAPGWLFGMIILAVFLTFNFLRIKQIRLIDVLQSAIDHRALDRLLRETNMTHPISLTPIALLMLLPVTLIGYYSFMPHSSRMAVDILNFLIVLAGCYVIYFVRNGVIRLVGNAFGNSESIDLYLSNNYMFHLLYAVVASVMAFFVCYTGEMGKTFLYITLGVLGLLMVIRFLRGVGIILTLSKTSKFYLFYYLCILEIVPIVLIAKVATSL